MAYNDHELLLAIQELMDGTVWDATILETIASLMVDSGYRIRDCDDVDLEKDE